MGAGFLVEAAGDVAGGAGAAGEEVVAEGDDKNRQDRGQHDAGENHDADHEAGFGPGAGGKNQGYGAGGGGDPGHDDGAQADAGRFAQGGIEGHAFIAQLVGELDDEDAVFGGQADEHDESDLAVEVERAAGEVDAENTAGDGQRHGQHDDKRMHIAFELRGQHEEDNGEAEDKNKEHGSSGLPVIFRLALVVDDDLGRENFAGGGFEVIEHATEGGAFRDVALDGDGADAVVAVEDVGVGQFGELHDIGEGDEFAGAVRADVDVFQIGRRALAIALAFEDDIVFLAFVDIGGDAAGAEHGFEGAADGLDGHAEVGGAVVVDLHLDLRFGFLVVPIERFDAGVVLPDAFEEEVTPNHEFLVVAAADDKLDGLLDTGAEALAHDGEGGHAGEVGEFGADFIHDLPAGAALVEGGEDKDGGAGVEAFGAAEGARGADEEANGFAVVDVAHEAGLDFVEVGPHVFVGGALGSVDQHEERAAVLAGGVFAREAGGDPGGEGGEGQEGGNGGNFVA